MTDNIYLILKRKFEGRDQTKPWVFWRIYKDWKTGKVDIGPYGYRKTLLKTLCKKAGIKSFGYHALRHSGASIMDEGNVPIGTIQKILGHENRTTTEIYLHSRVDSEREAISVFEQNRKKSHTESHIKAKRDRS